MGLLGNIEATITVEQSALPRLHKHRPIPFALKDKVEEALQSQVAQGELVPVERSEGAAPMVDSAFAEISRFQLTSNLLSDLSIAHPGRNVQHVSQRRVLY